MTRMTEKKGLVPKVSRDLTPFDEMDRLFDRLFEGGYLRPFVWRWPEWSGLSRFEAQMPRVDVIDRDDSVLVRAELPGVQKDNLEVTFSDEYLTIKGETHEESEQKEEFYRSEIHHGTFSRTVHMPTKVEADKANAEFKDGILEITIPKAERTTRHTIEIK